MIFIADLMEVVGEEEIEGWDLDDDNEITEQELSSLIGKEQTENQSEVNSLFVLSFSFNDLSLLHFYI